MAYAQVTKLLTLILIVVAIVGTNAIDAAKRKKFMTLLPQMLANGAPKGPYGYMGVSPPAKGGKAPSLIDVADSGDKLKAVVNAAHAADAHKFSSGGDSGGGSAAAGADAEIDLGKLKHTIEWVDTLPPEWLMPGSEHMRHGVDVISNKEASRPMFHFTYGGVNDPYGDAVKSRPVNTMQNPNDSVWWYPDQLAARGNSKCEFAASSETFSSASEYSSKTAVSAGLSAEVAAVGAFSASASAASVSSGSQSGSRETFISNAYCLIAGVTNIETTSLHPEFEKALKDLPPFLTASDKDKAAVQLKYNSFFRMFGTHYYGSADLGGRLTQMSFVAKTAVASSDSSEVSASLKAKFSAGVAGGGASASGSAGSSKSSETTGMESESHISAFGGEPGSFSGSADGGKVSWGAWAGTIGKNPVLLNPTLKAMSTLPAAKERAKDLHFAMVKYVSKFSSHLSNTYNVVAAFEDQCLDTNAGCKEKAPELPAAWSKLARVADEMPKTHDAVSGIPGQPPVPVKLDEVVPAKEALTSADPNKFTTCQMVCQRYVYIPLAEDAVCTRKEGGLVVVEHKSLACTVEGCGSRACQKDLKNAGTCRATYKECNGDYSRPVTAKDKVVTKPIPAKNPAEFKTCLVACQKSTTFSNEDCKRNTGPLKGLVTVKHQGKACNDKGCSHKECQKEITGSGICLLADQKCNSKYTRELTTAENHVLGVFLEVSETSPAGPPPKALPAPKAPPAAGGPPVVHDSPPMGGANAQTTPRDFSNREDYARINIKGTRSSINNWVLGETAKGQYVYGNIIMDSRETPTIGMFVNIDLKMQGRFRFLRLTDVDFGKSRIFDTRVKPTSQEAGRDIYTGLYKESLKANTPEKQAIFDKDPVAAHKQDIYSSASFVPSLTKLLEGGDNRYEFFIKSSYSRFLDSYGDVFLTLIGSGGSVQVDAPFYQEKYWSLVGHKADLMKKIKAGIAETKDMEVKSAGNLRFANFATKNGVMTSFFSYEGPTIGTLKSVEINVRGALGGKPNDLANAPSRVQREVALKICSALLNPQGPQTDNCGLLKAPGQRKDSTPNYSELSANLDYDGIDKAKCEQVKGMMMEGGDGFSCKFDSASNSWQKFEPAGEKVTANTKEIKPLCGKFGCKHGLTDCSFAKRKWHKQPKRPKDCEYIIPHSKRLFTESGADMAKERVLDVKQIMVYDYKSDIMYNRNLNRKVLSSVPATVTLA